MEDKRKYGTRNIVPKNDETNEEKYSEIRSARIQAEINKSLRLARNSLFVVGGITIVFNLFLINTNSQDYFGLPFYLKYLDVFIGVVFLGLGLAAFKYPFPSLLTGLLLYIGLNLLNAYIEPSSLASGIIMKVVIIVYLVKGLKNAKEAESKRETFSDLLDDASDEDIDEGLLSN